MAARRLYDSRHWRARRKQQLKRHPLCEECLKQNRVTAASEVHHTVKHHGDITLFRLNPIESLCGLCHRQRDGRGFSTEIGPDGWAVDDQHPANRDRGKARSAN